MIFSTSHSGLPSIISGGSSKKFGPCWVVSLYGVRREVWKTSWIFHVGGSQSLYATLKTWAATLKGPYHFGAILGVRLLGSRRFIPSNQTLVLMVKGVKRGLLVIQESCTFHCASWAALLASWIIKSHCSNDGTLVFLVGWCICGVYPISKSNGVFFVVADGQEFFVYWARGSHSCQLSCCVLQKICKYCSRVWLVLSLAPSV